MELTNQSGHRINLRDLEFENKVWKNRLEYLIKEIEIYIHHLENFEFELKESITQPLIHESVNELNEFKSTATTLKKKVIIQEEEIPLYIKDFPIDEQHLLCKDHQAIESHVNNFYHDYKQSIKALRGQYSTLLHTKEA